MALIPLGQGFVGLRPSLNAMPESIILYTFVNILGRVRG
jgi:hypothetical protein